MITSSALLAPAALLLIAAGAAKVADPTRTAGALAAMRWPSSPILVRIGAAAELILALATILIGGSALAMLVAASFLGFAVFVVAALRSGTPIGTCGCFGQADTPPQSTHVVVVVLLAAGAAVAAMRDAAALVDAPWVTWLVSGVIAVVAYVALADGARMQQRFQQQR